jgi:glycine/D-amino acid oxidase-like deaminating enzyme
MAKLSGKPDCCWVADAPKTDFPELVGAQECDAAIVGAGIVGLTTALSLLEAGKAVIVLEARQVGRQVTGRSSAKITAQHSLIYRAFAVRTEPPDARGLPQQRRHAIARGGHRADCSR